MLIRAILPTVLAAGMGAAAAGPAVHQAPSPVDPRAAETRAVAYLKTEVPRWRREHSCYSCHNNGDATRALIAAAARGHDVGDAIDDTLAWLSIPARWESNAMRGGSEDLPLARIQFASALAAMVGAGRATPDALNQAATLLIGHQQGDGSWRLSDTQILGGATFYGTALATAMARRSIGAATIASTRQSREKADAWLRTIEPASVLDASSVLLGLARDTDSGAAAQRRRSVNVLKRGQGPDGGWGPYVNSRSEPFDTALAVLALAAFGGSEASSAAPFSDQEWHEAVRRGRAYLVAAQNSDGSWPETTRPPNGESYAQRISTTAWALLALLASD